MKVPLYILGFLARHGPLHGYKLKKQISDMVADFAHIKLPTIYYHLEKMLDAGLVEARTEQEGRRPEKSVYTITAAGRERFQELLRGAMESWHAFEFIMDAALFFLDFVDTGEFQSSIDRQEKKLSETIAHIQEHRAAVLPFVPEDAKEIVKALFAHHEVHYKAEAEWIKGLRKLAK